MDTANREKLDLLLRHSGFDPALQDEIVKAKTITEAQTIIDKIKAKALAKPEIPKV